MKNVLLFFVCIVCSATTSAHTPCEFVGGSKSFDVIDRQPEFPGGSEAFGKWLKSIIHYPPLAKEAGIQGEVLTSFWVEKDGRVGSAVILRSPHKLLSDEVLRVLRFTPRWIPGKEDGKAIRVRYTVPFSFRLEVLR